MADAAYSRRDFAGGAAVTTLSGSISSGDASIGISSSSGWPSGTNGEFFVVIAKGTAAEEKVRIDTRSGTTLTVTSSGRGVDGTSAAAHAAGVSIEVCGVAQDFDEANKAVAETVGRVTTAGDMLYGSGANALSRLAVGASGRVLISSGSAPTWQALSGDVTVSSSGVTAIGADKVTSAMIAADAVGSSEIAAGAVGAAEIASAVAGDGLAGGAGSALSVNVDGSTIETSSDTLRVKDSGVTAAKLAVAARPRYIAGPFVVYSATTLALPMASQMPLGIALNEVGTWAEQVMIEAGSIIGVTVTCDGVRSAGAATFEVCKNGSGVGLSTTIDGSNTTRNYATQSAGSDTFVAGDRLGVIFTSTNLAGVSGLVAHIWCQVT